MRPRGQGGARTEAAQLAKKPRLLGAVSLAISVGRIWFLPRHRFVSGLVSCVISPTSALRREERQGTKAPGEAKERKQGPE